MEIKPRFPLMGGWNFTFLAGWDQVGSDVIRQGVDGRYVVGIPMVWGVGIPGGGEVGYESVSLKVVLPEGAT